MPDWAVASVGGGAYQAGERAIGNMVPVFMAQHIAARVRLGRPCIKLLSGALGFYRCS